MRQHDRQKTPNNNKQRPKTLPPELTDVQNARRLCLVATSYINHVCLGELVYVMFIIKSLYLVSVHFWTYLPELHWT